MSLLLACVDPEISQAQINSVHQKATLLCVLIAALGLILGGRATGQTFTTLYSFTAFDPTYGTNSDGGFPSTGLILSGNALYGATFIGGSSAYGTVGHHDAGSAHEDHM